MLLEEFTLKFCKFTLALGDPGEQTLLPVLMPRAQRLKLPIGGLPLDFARVIRRNPVLADQGFQFPALFERLAPQILQRPLAFGDPCMQGLFPFLMLRTQRLQLLAGRAALGLARFRGHFLLLQQIPSHRAFAFGLQPQDRFDLLVCF